MARVKIKLVCSLCGEVFTHTKDNFYYKEAADKYEKWAVNNITMCPKCYSATKRQKKAQSLDNSISEHFKLAELTGTEKQIKWATEIRRNAIYKALLAKNVNQRFYDTVNSIISAEWWINNRDETDFPMYFFALLREYVSDEKREEKDREYSQIISENKLIRLHGTEKQIKWANEIRDNALKTLLLFIKPETRTDLIELANEVLDAKWWIDNKEKVKHYYTFKDVMREIDNDKAKKIIMSADIAE